MARPKLRFTEVNVRKMSAQVIEAVRSVTYSLGGKSPPSVPNLKFTSYGVSSCLANFKFEKHTRINFF
jgi:hypothetical protein